MDITPHKDIWSQVSGQYSDKISSFEESFANEIAEILLNLEVAPGASLLEMGCGSGHLSLELARKGYKTTLLDFESSALEHAKAMYSKYGVSGEFIYADLLDTSLNLGNKFDVVWNSGVLEHFNFEKLVHALSQMAANSANLVLIIVPNADSLTYLLYRLTMAQDDEWNVGVEFLRANFADAIEKAGLKLLFTGFCGKEISNNFFQRFANDKQLAEIYGKLESENLVPDSSFVLSYYICSAEQLSTDHIAPKPTSHLSINNDDQTIEKTLKIDSLSKDLSDRSKIRNELQKLCDKLKQSCHELQVERANLKAECSHRYEVCLELLKKLEYALNGINGAQANLSAFTATRVYRLARFCELLSQELMSGSIHRCSSFISRFFKYILGNSGAFAPYAETDPICRILEQLDDSKQDKSQIEFNTSVAPQPAKTHTSTVPSCNLPAIHTSVPRVAYLTNMLLDWNTHMPRYGGGERYCLNLSRLLRDLGYTVDIYQMAYKAFEGEYYDFTVRGIPQGNSYSEFTKGAAIEFYNHSLNYDHVIYNLPELASAEMRSDAIMICHGIWFDHNNYGPGCEFRTPEWYNHLHAAFSNPAHVVSVDTNSINVIRAHWPELARKMRYIPNFVDVEFFKPPESPRKNEPPVILFPRRSQVNRGSRILGDILGLIQHDAAIYWVGEGDAEDTQRIKDLCKTDTRLHYVSASFDEMPDWYRKADICVIPTIACEGTSLSCIEALACSCAVVSTNVGGLSDLIQDNINGLLVHPEPAQIASAINKLIEDIDSRRRLQFTAVANISNFTLNTWQGRWKNLFQEIGWLKTTA